MPAVSKSQSLWHTSRYGLRIGVGTVTDNHANPTLGCSLAFEFGLLSTSKQVDRFVAVQIDHDRTVGMSASDYAVVNGHLSAPIPVRNVEAAPAV